MPIRDLHAETGALLNNRLYADLYAAYKRFKDGDHSCEGVVGDIRMLLDSPCTARSALVVHELATNAVKYGALSADGGHISLTWTAARDGGFEAIWTESGGPTVSILRPTAGRLQLITGPASVWP